MLGQQRSRGGCRAPGCSWPCEALPLEPDLPAPHAPAQAKERHEAELRQLKEAVNTTKEARPPTPAGSGAKAAGAAGIGGRLGTKPYVANLTNFIGTLGLRVAPAPRCTVACHCLEMAATSRHLLPQGRGRAGGGRAHAWHCRTIPAAG